MPNEVSVSHTARTVLEGRRGRLLSALGRAAAPVFAVEPLPADRLEFFRREGEELYWNELSWEELTDEEAVCGGHLTELVFPGFLAFIEGLLLDAEAPGSAAPARPHSDAVEAILEFLACRYAELTRQIEAGADSQRLIWARAMTLRLLDLVLYRLYRLTAAEQERIDGGG